MVVYKCNQDKDFNESEIDNYSFQEFKKQSKKLNQVKSFLTNLKKIGLELEFV